MAKPEASGRIVIDEREAPLYVVSFDGVTTDDQFRNYLDHVLCITKRGERHAMVYDATHAGWIPPSQRKLQADWMREHDKLNRDTTAGLSFVLPSPLLRGVLTAILWLQPMPCPHSIVSTLDEGLSWCRARLRDRPAPSRTL